MGRNIKTTSWFGWFALAIFIATILTMLYNVVIRRPKAKIMEQQLEMEFNSLAPMPSASPIHSEKSHKAEQALVVTRYVTYSEFPEVRAYYNSELSGRGWQFISERSLTDWGQDRGKKKVHYCKGEWAADVEYMGQASDGRHDYAIAVSWDGGECK